MKIFAIALGGALGALLRYSLMSLIGKKYSTHIPWGVIAVNLIGSYLIGFSSALFDRYIINRHLRTFLFIGLLGAFTTFSTYILESYRLFQGGMLGPAFLNILISTMFGFLLVFAGFMSARVIISLTM